MTAENPNNNDIAWIVAAIIALLLLLSCGARTINKDTTTTDSTATTTQVTKVDSTATATTKIGFDVTVDEICIEPVDTTKPIEVTNKKGEVTKYKNARLSHKKRKDNTIVVKEENVSKIVVDSLTNEIEVNKEIKTKIVYKEQFNWSTFILSLWWLWLLILIALYLAYRYYKGTLKFPLF